MLTVRYQINVTVVNQLNDREYSFNNTFSHVLELEDSLLYNNYHTISSGTYILDFFKSDISALASSLDIPESSLEVESFEINSS